jgi:hypothetical protein|tara:strand:+ start:1065 stop:1178 length:114 start_codon:yes stop_codon:yes gene_type:complete
METQYSPVAVVHSVLPQEQFEGFNAFPVVAVQAGNRE